MDASSGKRACGGPSIPRKGSGFQVKEAADNGDMKAQFCNRLGCHGRLNHTKVTNNKHATKLLTAKPSTGKAIVGSSTNSSSIATVSRLPLKSSRKGTSSTILKTDQFEASGSSSKIRMMEVGGSSSSSSSSSVRVNNKVSGSSIQEDAYDWSFSLASKNSSSSNTKRFSLKSGRCNTTQDVVSSVTSITNLNRKKDIVKKQNPAVETKGLLRGKKISEPMMTTERGQSSYPSNGISISDTRQTRTQRLTNNNNRAHAITPPTGCEVPLPHASFQCLPVESSSGILNFNQVADGSSGSSTGHSSPSVEIEGTWRYSMFGLAEVLWAIENADQDEGITREQLLAMEAQFFLNGINFHDQHRDMRLDIDNMSYEELLALEEKMGNVSTAIAEEQILKHLRKSIHQHTSSRDHDDIKCSICQEEYKIGEEIWGMDCNHLYHLDCIHQWLQVKKWCPICKTEAAPTDT